MASDGSGVRYYHRRELAGVELCVADAITAPPPAQFHDWFELRLIRHGAAMLSLGTTKHAVAPGALVAIRPGEFCAMDVAEGSDLSFVSLCVDPTLLRTADRNAGAAPSSPVFVDAGLADLLAACERAMTGATGAATAKVAVQRAIAELADRGIGTTHDAIANTPDPLFPPLIRQALAILRQRSPEDISLDELATNFGLSRFHFLRLFAAHLGVTPHRYQLLLRVALARTLLRNGVDVADTAFAAGFADQSHLTRCFHAVIGVPPRRFQQNASAPRVGAPRAGL